LLHKTGSLAHVNRLQERAARLGIVLSDHAVLRGKEVLSLKDETDLYHALELAYIPPELREGLSEIDDAEAAYARGEELPLLIQLSDIHGIIHAHSSYSDGNHSLEDLARGVQARGFSYLGISDHSQSAAYAGGLSVDAIRKQHAEIDILNAKLAPFRIFKG